MVRSTFLEGMEQLHVCELLNEDRTSWNEGLIRGILVEEEVELVLSIPFSLGAMKDRRIWVPEKTGKYNVKTAYMHLLGARREY